MLFLISLIAFLFVIANGQKIPCPKLSEFGRFCILNEVGDYFKCDAECNRYLGNRLAWFQNPREFNEAVALGKKHNIQQITTGL